MDGDATARQRRRRERLKQAGRVERTFGIRADQVGRVRQVVAALEAGEPISPHLIRALQVLRGLRSALSQHGIAQAGVFGSVARGEDTAESDLDVVLVLASGADPDPLDLIHAEECVRRAFAHAMPNMTVDIALWDDMRDAVRARCDAEAIYAN